MTMSMPDRVVSMAYGPLLAPDVPLDYARQTALGGWILLSVPLVMAVMAISAITRVILVPLTIHAAIPAARRTGRWIARRLPPTPPALARVLVAVRTVIRNLPTAALVAFFALGAWNGRGQLWGVAVALAGQPVFWLPVVAMGAIATWGWANGRRAKRKFQAGEIAP